MAAEALIANGGAELRALRRLTEAQAQEIAQLREQVQAFRLLHDDEGEAQLLEVGEVRRELLQLRDVVWPEVLELRARRAEGQAEASHLRAELDEVQPVLLDAADSRAQLAEVLAENGELKARCNALVHELEKAVEHSERAEARLRELRADSGHAGALEQLRAARHAEARQRERAEGLALELANARMSIASSLRRPEARAASPTSRATEARREQPEARERARGAQALGSAAEAARRWTAVSGLEHASPGRRARGAAPAPPAARDESEGNARPPKAAWAGRAHTGALADEALSAKLRQLHASFREALPS